MKRFLSLLAVLAMVLSMIPVVSFAAEERTVWVDFKNGSNDNSGLSEDAPVKNLSNAYAALSGADAGRIVFLSTTSFSGGYSFPQHTIPVTLTSKNGDVGLKSGYNLYFGGPTTLENITVTCSSSNAYTLLCGNGHKFVVGENVTSLETGGYRFCIQGAANTANSSSVDLTVAETKDGVNWNAAAVLEFRTGAVQYSYPAMIRTRDGLVHITYSWHRKFIKHVVLDPAKLVTAPIVDGQWPKEELPWVMSADSIQVNSGRDTEVLK